MRLLLNLSVLGKNSTGLGVYAAMFASVLSRKRPGTILACEDEMFPGEHWKSPENITLGAGKAAALKRHFFLRKIKLDKKWLVISPTHHGLPNAANQVITIHDLIALHSPRQHIKQWLFFRFVLPRMARRALAVFTVSHTSAADISNRLKIPAEKIYVVPNAFDRKMQMSEASRDDFLLAVGARYRHKNIHELLERHELWAASYRLIIVSAVGAYGADLAKRIKTLGLEARVELHGYVPADELNSLYKRCTALVYPSKCEGFGIPALEGMARDAQIILSDIPVHREVCEDAALYVQLGSVQSWEKAFADLRNTASVSSRKARYGHILEKYSLENFELKLLNAVDDVLMRLGSE